MNPLFEIAILTFCLYPRQIIIEEQNAIGGKKGLHGVDYSIKTHNIRSLIKQIIIHVCEAIKVKILFY